MQTEAKQAILENFRRKLVQCIDLSDDDCESDNLCDPVDENIPWTDEMDSPAQSVKSHNYKQKSAMAAIVQDYSLEEAFEQPPS